LRLLAHDLNNPLTAIRLQAETLREECAGDPLMAESLVDILEAADLASAVVAGMSSLMRLERDGEEYTWFPIDIVQILRHVVDRPALRPHVRLSLPRELHMQGDTRALHRAFTDILVNSIRLVDVGETVKVSAEKAGEQIRVVIHHPGLGVPPELRHRLLDAYGAVELRRRRIPVTAVGLTYAQSVIRSHAGDLSVVDGPGSGMDAVITLGG